jgi:DNA recombination protein RmuC
MDVVVIIVTVIICFTALGWFISRKLSQISNSQKPDDLITQFIHSFDARSAAQSSEIREQTKNLNDRLDNASRVIGEVQKNIGEMSEIGRSMKQLQEFLQSPKLRGNVGEHILKELLGQMLPKNSFHLQYAFRSGEKVDAAITTSGGIVPIDSKFPMENFRKMMDGEDSAKKVFEADVKKHINDISRKYILTDEGTIDYALMYVPSEAVYYEIVNSQDLFDYAAKQRVLPVSPTTFYAYLRAILMSFEGQKVEAKAKEILIILRAIKSDYQKLEDNVSVLQKHITNAFNTMGSVSTSFVSLGRKIDATKQLDDVSRIATRSKTIIS